MIADHFLQCILCRRRHLETRELRSDPAREDKMDHVSYDLSLPLLESSRKCNTHQKCHILPKYLGIQSLCKGCWSSSYSDTEHFLLCCRKTTFTCTSGTCSSSSPSVIQYLLSVLSLTTVFAFVTKRPLNRNTETAESEIQERFKTNTKQIQNSIEILALWPKTLLQWILNFDHQIN